MKIARRLLFGWLVLMAASVVGGFAVRRLVPSFGGESDDVFSLVYSMASGEFVSGATGLRSGEVTAFMGGAQIDLRRATIMDGAQLSLRAWMGGIDVVVPAEWQVEIASTAFMGGVGNRTDPDGSHDGPLLLVSASAIMGGIEVHADPGSDGF